MRRFFNLLRDGWLIIGITLVMFIVLEYGYRLQASIRRSKPAGAAPARDSTQHPYAGQEWFTVFLGRQGLKALNYDLDPYRGYRLGPLKTRFINIDSGGARLTFEMPYDPATARRVFMFGGSSMWGYTARDSFTIASLLARSLATRGVSNVEVVNLAVPGYNATQELATLQSRLVRGDVPDVAIFFDGYNDMSTLFRYGEPGHMYEEELAAERLKLGRRKFWSELFGLGRHSQLVQRFGATRSVRIRRSKELDVGQACSALAGYYRNTVRSVAALGKEYGFTSVFFLQPYPSSSAKPLTDWEKSLPRDPAYQRCTQAVDSALTDRMGHDYYPLNGLFDADSATVFVDGDSHITETANAKVADRMAEVVSPLLP
jgi:lysophospholipase L1-like esterase